jgi:hypothetical protein
VRPVPSAAPPAPVAPPAAPVAVVPPVEPECPPLESSGEQIPVAMTKKDLKGPGYLATAIIAPKSGDLGVLAGTPVILMAHHLMDLPMVTNLLRVLYASWGVFLGYVGYKIVDAGSVYNLDWHAVLRGGFDAAIVSALVAFGIVQRGRFNDPAVSSSLSGSAKADAAATAEGTT